jgi:hypothetical protein
MYGTYESMASGYDLLVYVCVVRSLQRVVQVERFTRS